MTRVTEACAHDRRIEEIHDEGLAAIDAAASTEQLEELRVRLLGRKAELPNLLRGVGELEPAQRGQVGKRANEVRQALEARLTRPSTGSMPQSSTPS